MHPAIQTLGIPTLVAASAAIGSAAVSAAADAALGVCDPKFGCGFGLQFMAGISALAGLLLGIIFLCALVAYTATTKRPANQRFTLCLAAAIGLAVGVAWSSVAIASYM